MAPASGMQMRSGLQIGHLVLFNLDGTSHSSPVTTLPWLLEAQTSHATVVAPTGVKSRLVVADLATALDGGCRVKGFRPARLLEFLCAAELD